MVDIETELKALDPQGYKDTVADLPEDFCLDAKELSKYIAACVCWVLALSIRRWKVMKKPSWNVFKMGK